MLAGLLLLVLAIGVVRVWVYFSSPQYGQKVSAISQARLKDVGSVRVREIGDNAKQKKEGDTVCFSYQFEEQFSPIVEETETKCVVRSTLYHPKGALTVSWTKYTQGKSLFDDTGLVLRQKQSDVYTPVKIQTTQYQPLSFQTDHETTAFVDSKGGVLVVSLHDFMGSNDEAKEIVEKVLGSVLMK